jgi:hypothetical protein
MVALHLDATSRRSKVVAKHASRAAKATLYHDDDNANQLRDRLALAELLLLDDVYNWAKVASVAALVAAGTVSLSKVVVAAYSKTAGHNGEYVVVSEPKGCHVKMAPCVKAVCTSVSVAAWRTVWVRNFMH